ncbi:MAG: membrane-bound lytic murein transglycosylase MltF [Desulfatibacillaceae bacterium]
MGPTSKRRIWPWVPVALVATVLAVLGLVPEIRDRGPEMGVLEAIKARGEIIILTRYGSTTYYEGPDGPAGFEHDLVVDFANYLNVEPRFVIKDSVDDILLAMAGGEGDLGAAGVTATPARKQKYLFGPPVDTVLQQVVCRRGRRLPQDLDDLEDREILVAKGTSYEERLAEMKTEHPKLDWDTTVEYSTEQILEMVWNGEQDCTVADSNVVAVNRRYFPELSVAFPITGKQNLAWVMPHGATELYGMVNEWLEVQRLSGAILKTWDRYYAHTESFDYVDLATYHRRITTRLPEYEALFRRAGREYDLPWTLLAAQAYQESHWDRDARSPTGVRGIMMLTLNTAKGLGVKNRLDPAQSIMGGARYLRGLLDRLPESVNPGDRMKFALAAYNVGMGHTYDARTLARRLGKDPDSWRDIKKVLPLLSQKKYYLQLRHGYARGLEPVRYVQRIYDYHDILLNRLAAETRVTI